MKPIAIIKTDFPDKFGIPRQSGLVENACLPGCVWNATPRSLSPLERNIGFWTPA